MIYRNDLVFPMYSANEDLCFIGIDPGSNRLGLAVLHVDPSSLNITSVKARTIRVDLLTDEDSTDAIYVGKRTHKLERLTEFLTKEMERLSPFSVAHETAYYNPKMPNAFQSLTEVISAIRSSVIKYSDRVMVIPLEPSIIKKKIGANPIGSKSPVRDALLMKEELMRAWSVSNRSDFLDLDDHSHDAVAIAYTSLMSYIEKSERF